MSAAQASSSTVFDYQPPLLASDSTIKVMWWLPDDPEESSVAFGYEISGEEFFVEVDSDEDFFIRHPAWSLVGAGASLLDAERDLRNEALDLREVLSNLPFDQLDEESIRLLRFLDAF